MEEKTTRADEMLDAFTVLAGKYTIDNTTMRDIANHMGISVGTIYLEFKGKEDLIRALFERFAVRGFQGLDEDLANCTSIRDKLHALTVGYARRQLRVLDENSSIAEFFITGRVSLRYLRNNFFRIYELTRREHLKRISAALKEGVDSGAIEVKDLEAAANGLIHAFAWYPFEAYNTRDRSTVDCVADTLFDLFYMGMEK
jgi:AcrR family transcriptional regulator